MSQNNARRGMTLLEVMLAIVLGTGVLMSGRLMLDQMHEARHVLAEQRDRATQRMAAERQLRTLVYNMDGGMGDSLALIGTAKAATWNSWCATEIGDRVPCVVHLTVDTTWTLRTEGDVFPPLMLRRDSVPAVLRYLTSVEHGGRWIVAWRGEITLPLAVGIIAGTDTTVLRIGDRG